MRPSPYTTISSITNYSLLYRLKDSDVTWLYGPLHVGTDWTDYRQPKKTLHKKTSMDHLPSLASPSAVKPSAPTTKPILKRRSISQLLSLPASPFFDQDGSEENDSEDEDHDGVLERPKLLHTKSDTHISWRSRPHRKDSPPRIIASEVGKSGDDGLESATGTSTTIATEESSRSSTDSSQSDELVVPKKKHISFNTFVEQCIAIEKPKAKRKSFVGARTSFFHDAMYDDGSVFISHVFHQSYTDNFAFISSHSIAHSYDEDSEAGYEYESDEPSSFFLNDRNSSDDDEDDEDDDDDDDDVLEMRTSRSRSSSISSSRSHHTAFTQPDGRSNFSPLQAFGNRPQLTRQASVDRERVTIAPIAPTILKSTGVGNNLTNIVEGKGTHIPKEVALVYVPPSNSIYSLPGTPNVGSNGGNEEVYHHRESYFSIQNVNANPSPSRHTRSLSAGSSPAFAFPSPPPNPPNPPSSLVSSNNEGGLPRTQSKTLLNTYFGQRHIVDSPQEVQTDAYDYFGGPDLGEDFGHRHAERERRTHLGRRRRSSTDDKDDEDEEHVKMVRYAQGGASSVPIGRSSGESRSRRDGWSGVISNASSESLNRRNVPSVVVNEVAGAEEEREEDNGTPIGAEASSSASTPLSIGAIPIAIRPQPRESPDVQMGNMGSGPMSMGSGPTNPSPLRQSALPAEQSYLTPPEPANTLISRGRSPQCVVPSHSGSTTTGSYSHSSDSRSESRGRSSTRTSSYSDPERSRSRGSRGTNSPMGSISPTGSTIGVGGAYQGRGRDRDSRVSGSASKSLRGRSSGGGDEERGRDRSGRRLENSMSPPSAVGSPVRVPSDIVDAYQPYQPYSPALLGASLERRPHSPSSSVVSGDSGTTSSSTVGPKTAHAPKSESGSSTASEGDTSARNSVRPRLATVPSPIPEEEESKSRMSTPPHTVVTPTAIPTPPRPHTPPPRKVVSPSTAAQSPMKPVTPPSKITTPPSNSPSPSHNPHHVHHHAHASTFHSPNHSVRLSKATVVQPVTSPSEATATTSPPLSPASIRSVERSRVASPEREGLVGRAADLVSSARGFLGSIWNSSSSNSNSLNG